MRWRMSKVLKLADRILDTRCPLLGIECRSKLVFGHAKCKSCGTLKNRNKNRANTKGEYR